MLCEFTFILLFAESDAKILLYNNVTFFAMKALIFLCKSFNYIMFKEICKQVNNYIVEFVSCQYEISFC